MFVFLKRDHISRKKCIHSVMANTFPTWYQLTGLREDFKSYLLVSVSGSNPKAKQVFAFSTIDTQALCKCFHKANYPYRSLWEPFFWLLTFKCPQPLFAKVFIIWEELMNPAIFWRRMLKASIWKMLPLCSAHWVHPADIAPPPTTLPIVATGKQK